MKYKLSKFNYIFKIDNNTIGIFNTFSNALVSLSLDEFQLLQDYPSQLISSHDEKEYISNGILVPYTRNENVIVSSSRIQSMFFNRAAVYRILPTLDCNARCFYCYESKKNSLYMDKEIAAQVCRFILDHSDGSPISIQWFGGEPLMNIDAIEYISSSIHAAEAYSKVKYEMITNGSLITKDIITNLFLKWNISKVQITLDGTEKEYEKRKHYHHILDPFHLVIKNILLLCEAGIKVCIRLNYDFNNYIDIISLINYLGSFLPRKENVKVYAYHLFTSSCYGNVDLHKKKEWFRIQNALIEQGFSEPLKTFSLKNRMSQCFACQTKGFVITPNGELYKCAMATGDRSACIGNVWEGITNFKVFDQWCSADLKSECSECVFLPICQGGCRAGILNYSSESCFTVKDFIDDILVKRIQLLQNSL